MSDLFLIPSGVRDFVINKTYSDSALLIEIIPPNFRTNWYKAGTLKILLPVGNRWVPISNKPILLTWEQIIEVRHPNCRFAFTPETWLDPSNFIVTPYTIQYNPMGINYSQIDKQTGPIVNTTVAALITSVQLLPVDLLRHEGVIYNRTNKTIFVAWGTAAATAADLAVPAGANLDIPEDFTGAVQAIGAAGITGSVLSQTVSFI